MSNNKIPFGLKDGVLVQASEVQRGLACGCVCPSCHKKLQANKGPKIPAYFSHDPSVDTRSCVSPGETAIHLMAKQILSEEGRAVFPEYVVEISHSEPFQPVFTEKEIVESESTRNFSDVKLEHRLEGARPDIVAYGEEGLVLIEIAVTHFTDEEKKRKIWALRLPAIEVDLSHVSYDITKEELKSLVIENVDNKKWISIPKAVGIKEKLRERLDKKIRSLKNRSYGQTSDSSSIKQNRKQDWSAGRTIHCYHCGGLFPANHEELRNNPDTVICPFCEYKLNIKPL